MLIVKNFGTMTNIILKNKVNVSIRWTFKGVKYVFLNRLSSQIVERRWVPCPINKRVSYTNLVSRLAMTLKMDIIIELEIIRKGTKDSLEEDSRW